MNEKFRTILTFFRIMDQDGQISLTSLSLIVALSKLTFSPSIGLAEIGLLLTSMAAYQGKKLIHLFSPKEPSGLETQVTELNSKLEEVQNKVSGLLLTGLGRK